VGQGRELGRAEKDKVEEGHELDSGDVN